MVRTKSNDFGNGAFPYARLEGALAVMLGANSTAQTGALRGRLKRLATLGLPGAGPGKGTRRQYTWEEAAQLAIALLMQDGGLDPTIVVLAIRKEWPQLAAGVKKALAGEPMLLVLSMQLVAGPWSRDPSSALPSISAMPGQPRRETARPPVVALRKRRQGDHVISPPAAQLTISTTGPGWIAVRDLTAELSKLRAAL